MTSGFDPIFFLHHANVDRLLSSWPAINPGVWVTRSLAGKGTSTTSPNVSTDTDINLAPLWDSQKDSWVSSETTGMSKLAYSYPVFNGLDLSNTNDVQDAMVNYINQQYGGLIFRFLPFRTFPLAAPTTTFAAQSDAAAAGPASAPEPAAAASVSQPFTSHGGTPQTAAHAPFAQSTPKSIQDWTVRIRFKKHELGGSFAVLIFLGEVPIDAAQWRTSPNFVGSHHAFVSGAADQRANLHDQVDFDSEGFVHLNAAIARLSGLSSFEIDVISPYLKENLDWRIQAADRTAVEADRLPSLEVTVSSTLLTQEPGTHFPIAGDPQYHHHITHGRQGGARTAQT
ncbi:hypothetical protein BC834DRAFT_841744 [Gloeopeniophorella convolvens]|nr:hypothetical protein BC834DRAFT_841744 [Gloeopeniophorella convolvens]